MEITIDLYSVGKFVAKWSTRLVMARSSIRLFNRSSSKVSRFAEMHRIDSSSSAAVTENLFECLKYLD